MPSNEQIRFRLIACPACNHQICWINPRLPSFCPECAQPIYLRLRNGQGILAEATAWLRIENADPFNTGQAAERHETYPKET